VRSGRSPGSREYGVYSCSIVPPKRDTLLDRAVDAVSRYIDSGRCGCISTPIVGHVDEDERYRAIGKSDLQCGKVLKFVALLKHIPHCKRNFKWIFAFMQSCLLLFVPISKH
jgi:hypothetical protein